MDRAKRNEKAFEDFEWMEKMDDFDKQVEQELWEEEFIRSCIEQLLEEEEERETMTAADILKQMENERLEGRSTENKPQVDVFSSADFINSFNFSVSYYEHYTFTTTQICNVNVSQRSCLNTYYV